MKAASLARWLGVAVLFAATAVQAQTSWKGTSSTSWSTAANWTAGVPTASADAIIGDSNFTGANQPSIGSSAVCKSLTLGAGTKASTLTVGRGLTVSGNVTIGTNGTLSHTTSTALSLTGNWTNNGVYSPSATGRTITFSGTAQNLAGTSASTYRKITVNSGSTLTLATNITANNTVTVGGTLDPGAAPGFTLSGSGGLTVSSGGKLLVRATTFAGNYSVSGTKTLSAGSAVDYAATGNQTIATNLTYSTLRISGSGVKTPAGNPPALASSSAAAGIIDVTAATLDLAAFTANRGTSVAGGTFNIAAGAILKIGGTRSFPSNYVTHAIAPASTIEYYGTNQIVKAESYGNLILSSSGAATKTMPTNALAIAGNFTSATNAPGASVAFTAGAAVTVSGNVSIGRGTTFSGGAFAHSIGGNWTNNGTFTGNTSTVSMAGVNTILSGGGTNNFFNLALTRSGITADADTSLNVAGDFSTGGAGTFTHIAGGAGALTMSGAGKTIGGSGIVFSKLMVSGSVSSAASFTVADDLVVNGSLANSAGTITLSGTGKRIYGTGAVALNALAVPGSITTTNNLSLTGNLNVSGSFAATAGMLTFAGSTTVSGTAGLFNSTLNGTLLQMGAGSVLQLAGTTTLAAGTFDVTSQLPNTIVYNSTGSQAVYPITYYHLEIAPGGTKTIAGSVTVLGNLTIDAGAVFSGGAGGYTNSVRGNWLNYGTYTAGNSTVEMAGPSDSTITGATTFNKLRVNKDNANLLVNLVTNNQTVATLDMALGTMNTGTNTLTITATRTGNGHVLGTITRQHSFSAGVSYAFESPFTTINFAALASVSSVTMTMANGSVSDFPSGAAVSRQYTVSLVSGGAYNATLRAYYRDAELNGNDEATMALWRNGGSLWALAGKTGNDTVNNWIEQNSITDLAGRWTMSGDSGVVRWNGSVSTAWETPANWTVVSGTPSQPPDANDIVELGTVTATYQPTITTAAAVKSLSFGSAQAMTLTMSPGAALAAIGIQAIGNVGGIWTNDTDHIINVGAQTLTVGGDLTLSDGTTNHTINLIVATGTV
ncbi:MAG: hypothetical protein NTZ16_09805, partial [Verrucomicrobia bacterium]|nr:hypothetical protein [Verrucomicrobiota bacterium]